MSNILTVLEEIGQLFSTGGVSQEEIAAAEERLNVKFAADYIAYLKKYGCAAFGEHEFMGLGSSKRLNVCEATQAEKRRNAALISNKYVIETLYDGALLILQGSDGVVVQLRQDGTQEHQHSDFAQYVLSIK